MAWTLAQAKEHLEEIVERAANDGPQTLVLDGEERGVLISPAQWRLMRERQPTMKEIILSLGPLDDLDLERNPLPSRNVEL